MNKPVRVRFAPSPTGPLHIGGVRTALFNYLFAKKHKGSFVLRIEDTDQSRYVAGAEEYIKESLNWCGIPYDEGPDKNGNFGSYRQSQRKDLYHAYAKQLIDTGKAYYAFDTSEQLNAYRKDHEARGKTFIYNWNNRLKLDNSLSQDAETVEKRIAAGEDYVVRFKMHENEQIQLTDLIRGSINIDSSTLDDKVLFKSDGMPTYHLANIVDDHLMEITHVIRGEEWLPSLALHHMLYRSFGWDSPEFAHLPLILKPAGMGKGKLSKRDGTKGDFPVFPLQWEDPNTQEISKGYKDEGYLPQAVVNMLALLGWNPGTEQEFFSLDELVNSFDLTKVNKAGARFDPEKTKWFQQHYLQKSDDEHLVKAFQQLLIAKGVSSLDEKVTQVVLLLKERAVFVKDLWESGQYFFKAPTAYDPKAVKKAWKEDTPAVLTQVKAVLETCAVFDAQPLQDTVKNWITVQGLGFGKVMQPLRLSLVGSMQGPDVFKIAALLGKEETLLRIQHAISSL